MKYTDRENTAAFTPELEVLRRAPLGPGLARSVRCDDERIYVTLDDGREVSLPLTCLLRDASAADRATGTVTDDGMCVTWEAAGEDIGVHTFLGLSEADIERFFDARQTTSQAHALIGRSQPADRPS